MANRINRASQLPEQDQAIYYDGSHSGHVLTDEKGRIDARAWAGYLNVGMERRTFVMARLAAYLRSLVADGPARSGHRTSAVMVEAPVNGTDEANVGFAAWVPADPMMRRARHSVVPDGIGGGKERLPISVPLPASPGWHRSGAALAGSAADRRRAARSDGRIVGNRHARARVRKYGGPALGRFYGPIHVTLLFLAAEPAGGAPAGLQTGKSRDGRERRHDLLGALTRIRRNGPSAT
jgi:hypothetical protein